ncbi:hypothetical protein DOTSEDRAFT_75896 [Dothistroma septosporum NZE10]|uniref:Uncharacterized protein n=1 Tax=Dothistroma septosporum (strain NZE10 / CBS 128990) TaxID=675120 RepID=N1PCG3_DOTSN|nr:hypothetical protein DOTSEDRAFT_75896 [Dothistroma septosporum NZE10]
MSNQPPPRREANQCQNENATTTPFSKRPIKRAPLQNQDNLKERRRTNFLRNVRDKREDRHYEARGEDIMRLDFVQKRRAYEAELARHAPREEEEEELPSWSQEGSQMMMSSQVVPEEEEVEDFVRGEEGELEALLEFMTESNGEGEVEMEEQQELWSDDADYDALFEEVLSKEGGAQNQQVGDMMEGNANHVQQQQQQSGDGDAMDMS